MIQEGNELAGCEFQTFVSCNCYAGVRGQASEHYTTIAPLEIFGPAGEGGVARSIIDKAKLAILVHLGEERLHSGLHQTKGGVGERGWWEKVRASSFMLSRIAGERVLSVIQMS